MPAYRYITLCFIIIGLTACGKPLTEEEQYAKLQDSLKFKLYKSASEKAIPPLVTQANKQAKNKHLKEIVDIKLENEFRDDDAHLTLAFSWMLSMKPDLAIAESLIVMENSEDKIDRYRASSILALSMYQKGWKGLGATTSKDASGILNDPDLTQRLYYEQVSSYLAIGLLSIYQNDLDTAKGAFTAFGNLVEQTWLSDVAVSAIMIRQGEIKAGLSKLKATASNPDLPEPGKEFINGFIAKIEADAGDVDSPFFMVRLVGKAVSEKFLKQDNAPFMALVDNLEAFKKTVTFDNP